MQILLGSAVYRMLVKLVGYYQNSLLKKFVSVFILYCRNSFIARSFRAIVRKKSFSQYSLFLRAVRCPVNWIKKMFKRLYKWVDKLVLSLADSLQKWSGSSLLCRLFCFIYESSRKKLFILAVPIFGIGFFVGRLLLNSLRIRDILLLAMTFFAAAVLFIYPKKIKVYFKNSLFYKICVLVLE